MCPPKDDRSDRLDPSIATIDNPGGNAVPMRRVRGHPAAGHDDRDHLHPGDTDYKALAGQPVVRF